MATKPSINRNITSVNRTKGNSGRKWIVIHNVGTAPTKKGSAKANTVYFKSVNRGASAHFFVDVAEIWQCVELGDTAWHCGTTGKYYSSCRNSTSIGIELCGNGKFPDAEVALAAKLVQWLMVEYGIPASNVIRHYDVTHKTCPAGYIGSSDWSALKARLVGKSSTGGFASGGLEVDGLWGSDTTLRAQKVLGLQYQDGKVSRQNPAHKSRMPGCTLGWEWTGSQGKGSPLIKALQQKWGATADGVMGPDTINAMIGYYMARGSGATVKDGKLDRNSKTIKQFQRELNNGRV